MNITEISIKRPIADYRTFQRICPVGNYRLQEFEL
jgi:hypothetical protein